MNPNLIFDARYAESRSFIANFFEFLNDIFACTRSNHDFYVRFSISGYKLINHFLCFANFKIKVFANLYVTGQISRRLQNGPPPLTVCSITQYGSESINGTIGSCSKQQSKFSCLKSKI